MKNSHMATLLLCLVGVAASLCAETVEVLVAMSDT